MFIDREQELEQLERLYASRTAQLFVLYGRRRVGKTELLRKFCADKPNIFFVATLSADKEQLATFSQQVWRFTHPDAPEGFTFPGWEAALRALADLPGRPVVVLDEFTYLITGNRAIPSELQKVWDEVLRDSGVFLALCGSYIGMMEGEVLGYQAPLYGRRTGSRLLAPLQLPAAAAFFPRYTSDERIQAWAVLGGMPYYLGAFSDQEDVFSNIQRQILDTQGLLHHEPRLLLLEELREPRNYFSILRAIAQGRTRLNEITLGAGVGNSTTTGRYLDILQQMRIVIRSVPATESQPEKSKKGLYYISDAFLRFWFRYVHPNLGALALDLGQSILENRIRPSFEQFVGTAFEQAAREHIAYLALKGELPFLPERIGSWWDQQNEVDVAAVSDTEQAVLTGECKWSVKPVGVDILEDLKVKTESMLKGKPWKSAGYYLFSRSGFTKELRSLADRQGVRLVEAPELLGD